MLDGLIRDEFYVLDTETTGLDKKAQIVELGLIDQNGKKLIDTLVKPTIQIPDEAIAIHGITTEQAMEEGKSWVDVLGQLKSILNEDTDLVIYNADYDIRLIHQTSRIHKIPMDEMGIVTGVHCAMLEYAEYWGEETSRGYKWQSLVNACAQQNVKVENAHRAVADCQMTLSLINAVWGK